MKYEIFSVPEISDTMWENAHAIRNATPAYDDPFLDPEMAQILDTVRPDVRAIFAFDGEDIVGFLAFHLRPGKWGRPIGGPFSDWHAPLVKQGYSLDLFDFIRGAGLTGFTGNSIKPSPGQFSHCDLTTDSSHMSNLEMGTEAFLADVKAFHPKHAKKMRRCRRNLAKDFASVETNLNDTSDEAFEWLLATKSAQYHATGRHDVLASPWARQYLNALRTHKSERLSARLITLRLDGKLAAAEFNPISDRIMHGWLTVYDQDFSFYSPGYIIWEDILIRLHEVGLTYYDAGPDLAAYKKFYSNMTLPVMEGVIRGEGLSLNPTRWVSKGWRGAEHVAPQKAAAIMGKIRRRADQIVQTEIETGARLAGFREAAKQFGK